MSIASFFHRLPLRLTGLAIAVGALLAIRADAQIRTVCRDTAEGRVCNLQQPIVGSATLVSPQIQQDLGLVTLTNGCSGTLVNRFWVLTADHCVTSDGKINGPSATFANVTMTSVWSSRRVVPARFVRNWGASGLDVALVYLGAGDFGKSNRQLFFVDAVDTTMLLTKFGRGVFAYAQAGPPPVAAQQDGRYRTAVFKPNLANVTNYQLPSNATGQVGNGGDSGGADLVTAPNGITLGIAGVQSTCVWTARVPGMPNPPLWTWVTNISSCTSAAIGSIRFDLLQIIQEGRAGSDDFNDDSRGDILWHNGSTGEAQIWFMGGSSRIGRATVLGETGVPAKVSLPWSIVASNDMNHDGQTDIVWHNEKTGETQLWLMNGFRVTSRVTVLGETGQPAMVGLPWSIVGSNDMNGDGNTDLIWHNAATGETQVWLMRSGKVLSRATVLGENGTAARVGLPWSIVTSQDMNRDNKPDIVWHNSASNETQVWLMNDVRVASRATVRGETGAPALVGLPWSIVGANDFDQNGDGDLLWHNASTGETQIWFMKGTSVVRRATVDAPTDGGGAMVGLPWRITAH